MQYIFSDVVMLKLALPFAKMRRASIVFACVRLSVTKVSDALLNEI